MKLIFRTRRIYISNAYLHLSTFVGLHDEKVIYINIRRVYLVFRGSSIGASALIVKNGKQREEQMI
jgi:hypothetical protein